ncbi:hypothetical protein EYZ11_004959 [Aspergillus tanneri]|uniref:Uncharacterized protein n=1 Tax=Aspergillus tanneri TaxID=1220188 RepID=A0A4S3JLK0_9EURO|nr:hypothetical protein EYZ11_004959 [Aspergillus tanneri]
MEIPSQSKQTGRQQTTAHAAYERDTGALDGYLISRQLNAGSFDSPKAEQYRCSVVCIIHV